MLEKTLQPPFDTPEVRIIEDGKLRKIWQDSFNSSMNAGVSVNCSRMVADDAVDKVVGGEKDANV